MHKPSSFYIDVSRINIAHEFVLNRSSKCEYPNGRKYYGIILCISGKPAFHQGKLHGTSDDNSIDVKYTSN